MAGDNVVFGTINIDDTSLKKFEDSLEKAQKSTVPKLNVEVGKQNKLWEQTKNIIPNASSSIFDMVKGLSSAVALVGGLSGGFTALAKLSAKNAVETGFIASNIGSTQKNVDALRFAFKQVGAPAESANNALTAIATAQKDITKQGVFAKLGMDLTNIENRDPASIFFEMSKALQGLSKTQRLEILSEFGLGDIGEFGFLLEGDTGLLKKQYDKFLDEFALDQSIVDKQTEAFQRINEFQTKIGNTLTLFTTEALPAIDAMLTATEQFFDKFTQGLLKWGKFGDKIEQEGGVLNYGKSILKSFLPSKSDINVDFSTLATQTGYSVDELEGFSSEELKDLVNKTIENQVNNNQSTVNNTTNITNNISIENMGGDDGIGTMLNGDYANASAPLLGR